MLFLFDDDAVNFDPRQKILLCKVQIGKKDTSQLISMPSVLVDA